MKNTALSLSAAALAIVSAACNATVYDITVNPAWPATVDLGPLGSKAITGSNFTMLNPNCAVQDPGGATYAQDDVTGTFDDSKICFSENCTQYAISMESPSQFSGSFWSAHHVRVFGPGTYTFETCLNDGSTNCTAPLPITLTVGEGQLGAHMLFDWGNVGTPPGSGGAPSASNLNIDVIVLWGINSQFTRPAAASGLVPADTRTYTLASRDADGDGCVGADMLDGPFQQFSANFSLYLDGNPGFYPDVTVSASQAGNPDIGSNVVDTAGANVVVDSGSDPANTFDWSGSDAELLTACGMGCDTSSSTFSFDPTDAAIVPGASLIATVEVTASNGLALTRSLTLQMGCPAESAPLLGQDTDGDGILNGPAADACNDADGDGILDYLDPDGHTATQISASLVGGTVAEASGGILGIGSLAATTADASGNIGSGIVVSATDIGVVDDQVTTSCVGGCFDYTVTGGPLAGAGTSVQVVLPLSQGLPENPDARKFSGGSWAGFTEDTHNGLGSAISVAGVCPSPGDPAYTGAAGPNGLAAGNDCVQVTIEDNGPNDSDAAAGVVADPIGFAATQSTSTPGPDLGPAGTSLGGGSGCALAQNVENSRQHLDWWVLAAVIAVLGWLRGRQRIV